MLTVVSWLEAFEGRFVQKRGKPDGCAIFVRRALGAPEFRELVHGDGTGHVAAAAVDVRLGRAELTELATQVALKVK